MSYSFPDTQHSALELMILAESKSDINQILKIIGHLILADIIENK
jgi:hypothetical protein